MHGCCTFLYRDPGSGYIRDIAECIADSLLRGKSVLYVALDQQVDRATYHVYAALKNSAGWSERMEGIPIAVQKLPIGACNTDTLRELLRREHVKPNVVAIDYATLLNFADHTVNPLVVQNALLDFANEEGVDVISYIPAGRRSRNLECLLG